MNLFALAPLLIFLPAAGFLFNAIFGRRFVNANRKSGERLTGWLATAIVGVCFLIAVGLLLSLISHDYHAQIVPIADWINIPAAGLNIPWAIQVDTLSVTMMLVVTGVGSLIHIYAIGYMHGDRDFSRFFAYFSLFIMFMLVLVTANNYLMMFVGWEGVGLCSYLLISFWWDRLDKNGEPANANAGRKAMVVNRIGDLGVILAMILLFWTFGTLNYDGVFSGAVEFYEANQMVEFGAFQATLPAVLTAVTALFLLGVAGKSAQIPIYIWLPDAMAGPTPVSALIHAATMVTAGVYLLVRSNVLYEIVRDSGATIFGLISTPDLVAYVGAFTALFAGLIAFSQNDIKKVLAYSTISQLGFMVAAAGMGAYVAAMFHLITHAFFKALLFMGSGSVIHGMEHGHHHVMHEHHDDHHDDFDPQDMRTMGDIRHRMKTTFVVYMVGALALAGLFPLAGFWSKDEILLHGQTHELPILIILAIAALCTAFYVGRQLLMVFFGNPRSEAAAHAEESPRIMTAPLIVLAILTALGGLLNIPYLSAAEAERYDMHPHGLVLLLEQWEEHSILSFELTEEGLVHLPHTPVVFSPLVAGVSMVLALAGLGLAWLVYRRKPIRATDPDPLQRTPIWWFSVLPLNTLWMKGLVPVFNRFAYWLAYPFEWAFWHDFVHERVIRDSFVTVSNFTAEVIDAQGVDGIVNGSATLTRRIADGLRMSQTGYSRTYALSIFLGAVALLVYFLMAAN